MKPTFIALLALCLCVVGCGESKEEKAAKAAAEAKEESAKIIGAAIRKAAKKPTGELGEGDDPDSH